MRFAIASYQLVFWFKGELNDFFVSNELKNSSVVGFCVGNTIVRTGLATDDRSTGTISSKVMSILNQTDKETTLDISKFKAFLHLRYYWFTCVISTLTEFLFSDIVACPTPPLPSRLVVAAIAVVRALANTQTHLLDPRLLPSVGITCT
jgi:hypothetical protein